MKCVPAALRYASSAVPHTLAALLVSQAQLALAAAYFLVIAILKILSALLLVLLFAREPSHCPLKAVTFVNLFAEVFQAI